MSPVDRNALQAATSISPQAVVSKHYYSYCYYDLLPIGEDYAEEWFRYRLYEHLVPGSGHFIGQNGALPGDVTNAQSGILENKASDVIHGKLAG